MKTWRERISEARERGTFTSEERTLACSWMTCAVGEQRERFPEFILYSNTVDGAPKDWDLCILGASCGVPDTGFAHAVNKNMFDYADKLLDRIEDRVLQIKRESL